VPPTRMIESRSKGLVAFSGKLPYITSMTTMTATARLEARISPDLHQLVQRAARLQGRSLTDFVVSVVREAANKAIEQSHVLELSREDQLAFADALIHPPKPNEALRKAATRHRQLVERD